jgi:hypothetical protein
MAKMSPFWRKNTSRNVSDEQEMWLDEECKWWTRNVSDGQGM